MDEWSVELKCSREAIARAVSKLVQGQFILERKLVVRPLEGD